MGKTWEYMMADPQLRWYASFCAFLYPQRNTLPSRIGPEKGVIHIASGAVNNALWDMYARSEGKPLWKLVVDFSPEELVRSAAWRYISDAITKEEAVEMLRKTQAGKKERESVVRKIGYVSRLLKGRADEE